MQQRHLFTQPLTNKILDMQELIRYVEDSNFPKDQHMSLVENLMSLMDMARRPQSTAQHVPTNYSSMRF